METLFHELGPCEMSRHSTRVEGVGGGIATQPDFWKDQYVTGADSNLIARGERSGATTHGSRVNCSAHDNTALSRPDKKDIASDSYLC
jgi:hypothetical protein